MEDIQSASNDITVIAHPHRSIFHKIVDEVCKLEGCYLHYDEIRCAWKRSGKAAGSDMSVPRRGFGNRQEEHKNAQEQQQRLQIFIENIL